MIDDVRFRDVFFLTYRQHLTPAKLLEHLIAMHGSVVNDADSHIPNLRFSRYTHLRGRSVRALFVVCNTFCPS